MRIIKKGLLAGATAIGLLLPLATPASAINTGGFVFLGTATTPPLGYPTQNGNTGAITVTSNVCADGATDDVVGPIVQAGLCTFTGSGSIGSSIAGGAQITAIKNIPPLSLGDPGGAYCGSSDGRIHGTFTSSIGQSYYFDVGFTTAGGVVAFSGSVTKGTTGPDGTIAGVALTAPPPSVAIPPGNSCSARTATTFTIVGVAAFVIPRLV